ncbi:unnamed protein product [Ostreobium quekettii]|uniref:Amino acid transporter transmembrane domain-containing protein n=1 Tax=Ostreobium quekettii TaxID=121088 RepID=A0A8S1J2J7_9CHLO|nr:unnamed protein product [Ostreobium quekettii]|eukprot:evm.model.scf_769.1 EVM.evm.TU.scf_769.1   scf_769:10813-14894(+)
MAPAARCAENQPGRNTPPDGDGASGFTRGKERGSALPTLSDDTVGDSLTIPLLVDVEGAGDRPRTDSKVAPEKSSVGGVVLNLFNTMVGAGIMALPYQVATLGVVLGFVFSLALGYVLYLTAAALIRACHRSGHRTYTDVIRGELGLFWGHFVQWCIILQNTGGLAIYLIIIGDVLMGSKRFGGIVPEFAQLCGFESSIFTRRWFVLFLVCILFLLPLVSKRNLSALVHASAFANVLVVFFALVVAVLFVHSAVNGTLASMSWGLNRALAGSSPWTMAVTLLAALPTMMCAYVAHMNVPPLMEELRAYSRDRMILATRLTFTASTALYILVPVGAYAVFGEETETDILLNFTPGYLTKIVGARTSTILGTAVALFYVTKLILTFPLINWALRENLSDLFFGVSRPTGWRFYLVTYGALATSYLLSVTLGSIEIAMDFVGCTAVMGMALLAPAMLLAKHEWRSLRSRIVAVVCIILSGVILVVGNTKVTWQLLHKS